MKEWVCAFFGFGFGGFFGKGEFGRAVRGGRERKKENEFVDNRIS